MAEFGLSAEGHTLKDALKSSKSKLKSIQLDLKNAEPSSDVYKATNKKLSELFKTWEKAANLAIDQKELEAFSTISTFTHELGEVMRNCAPEKSVKRSPSKMKKSLDSTSKLKRSTSKHSTSPLKKSLASNSSEKSKKKDFNSTAMPNFLDEWPGFETALSYPQFEDATMPSEFAKFDIGNDFDSSPFKSLGSQRRKSSKDKDKKSTHSPFSSQSRSSHHKHTDSVSPESHKESRHHSHSRHRSVSPNEKASLKHRSKSGSRSQSSFDSAGSAHSKHSSKSFSRSTSKNFFDEQPFPNMAVGTSNNFSVDMGANMQPPALNNAEILNTTLSQPTLNMPSNEIFPGVMPYSLAPTENIRTQPVTANGQAADWMEKLAKIQQNNQILPSSQLAPPEFQKTASFNCEGTVASYPGATVVPVSEGTTALANNSMNALEETTKSVNRSLHTNLWNIANLGYPPGTVLYIEAFLQLNQHPQYDVNSALSSLFTSKPLTVTAMGECIINQELIFPIPNFVNTSNFWFHAKVVNANNSQIIGAISVCLNQIDDSSVPKLFNLKSVTTAEALTACAVTSLHFVANAPVKQAHHVDPPPDISFNSNTFEKLIEISSNTDELKKILKMQNDTINALSADLAIYKLNDKGAPDDGRAEMSWHQIARVLSARTKELQVMAVRCSELAEENKNLTVISDKFGQTQKELTDRQNEIIKAEQLLQSRLILHEDTRRKLFQESEKCRMLHRDVEELSNSIQKLQDRLEESRHNLQASNTENMKLRHIIKTWSTTPKYTELNTAIASVTPATDQIFDADDITLLRKQEEADDVHDEYSVLKLAHSQVWRTTKRLTDRQEILNVFSWPRQSLSISSNEMHDISYDYQELVYSQNGTLFQSPALHIHYKASIDGLDAMVHFRCTFRGESVKIFSISAVSGWDGGLIELTTAPINRLRYEKEVLYIGRVSVNRVYSHPPMIDIEYMHLDNTKKNVRIRLPLPVVKFCVPAQITLEEFLKFWNDRDERCTSLKEIVEVKTQFSRVRGLELIRKAIEFGGCFSLVSSASQHATSAVSAGIFRPSIGNSTHQIPCMIRAELGDFGLNSSSCLVELRCVSPCMLQAVRSTLYEVLLPTEKVDFMEELFAVCDADYTRFKK